eukprot:TRINITY_DN2181_c0_g1_i1.p1 TRINITY_DN2181_c0_g1~~TRINITY_DN2181_c0_g1_i1.p1  ORF type:complete len:733 (+),score=156.12 TRINITY_DN2181_c0_g1_i1:61-2199(+)
MQPCSAIASFFCLFSFWRLSADALTAARNFQDGHPIERVIKLLHELESTVQSESASEKISYTKFERWCANSMETLDVAISAGQESVSALRDSIASERERESILTSEIESLADELLKLQTSGAAAATQRSQTASLHSSANADYQSTIQAIDQALVLLTTAKSSVGGGFVQYDAPSWDVVRKVVGLVTLNATDEQRKVLNAFVQSADAPDRPDLAAAGDYTKHVKNYAFKSQAVIEMLKELKRKFEDQKQAANEAETNSLNSYALSTEARDNVATNAEYSKYTKETQLSVVRSKLGSEKMNLESALGDLEADSSTLASTKTQCALRKSEWDERSAIRDQEVKAIQAAVGILASVSGVRTQAPANPVLPSSPISFIQVAGPLDRVVNMLRVEAQETHSHALERLAREISVHRDSPFADVNNMIQKMIFRLMNEQKDEDTHKNWCDLELEKTNTSKVNKEDKADELSAAIEADTARTVVLSNEISSSEDMIKTIVQHISEAEEIRRIGKEENAVSVKDAQKAQDALAEAMVILEAFYKKTGMMKKEAWELVQRGVDLPTNPATWESSYTGVADPSSQPAGIIDVLKTLSAQFSKMEADTRAQEVTDQAQFDEDMKSCDIETARRTQEIEMKRAEKKRLVGKVASLSAQHKQVSNELESVEQYLKDLRPACVEGDSTYVDRKAARTQEIGALKEAQIILASAFKSQSTNKTANTTMM